MSDNHYESMSYIDKKREFESQLPAGLDTELRDAYIAQSMIGPPFYWKKLKDGKHILQGFPGCELSVINVGPVWSVINKTEEGTKEIHSCLEFDSAFKAAREYAFDHRRDFLFSDRAARFKAKPASVKQLDIIRKGGFEKGIENLTSGQAGAIMDAGILRRRKKDAEPFFKEDSELSF